MTEKYRVLGMKLEFVWRKSLHGGSTTMDPRKIIDYMIHYLHLFKHHFKANFSRVLD